ncbi:phycobilisome rod-core linker polypeptide [Synechococcus sp. PCC 7336]|uniref:phycobilisome rod-core linker polypeptide n=1 Tax=Synechococcus sp. PCC 7336 TaxID=195250 RepID=UPI00034AA7BB|nr:phycobilisome rod-core linker polypeptide [Synechococcus sp. PCC 7336]
MTIPLLDYPRSSQNQRVKGFEVGNDDRAAIYSAENLLSATDMDDLIAAAYRRVINEQQMTASSRNPFLESQLRSGQITVREFIRGLATSDTFRRRNLEASNNYRFVQMCIQRLLGRDTYDEREKFAWSIVLATKGLQGFIDALLNTDEYLENFGDDIVPYQRRRVLPQRDMGEISFEHMPRYGRDRLETLTALGCNYAFVGSARPAAWDWDNPPIPVIYIKLGEVLAKGGGILVGLGLLAVFLAYYTGFPL